MNFFDHQDRARRASRLLLGVFVLAVVPVIVILNVLVAFGYGLWRLQPQDAWLWMENGYWAWLSAGLLAMILFASWLRLRQVWGHGDSLALRLGANNIAGSIEEPGSTRLQNVVDEMAIAAGLPAPGVWIMSDSPGINAFVAGTRIDNAALVVTRGAIDQLSREQLQGVVAHEFSHIQHGDMRLNLQLTGVLAGLETFGQLGLHMLRASPRIGLRGSVFAAVGGLLLLSIGSLGWFGGRLIRAAFSRQREFLADAAAVQYTRNPQGVAGALATIRDSTTGALLHHRHVDEISHFCFALPLSGFSARWIATHPPLDERIRRIDRFFDLKQKARMRTEEAPSRDPRVGVANTDATAIGLGIAAAMLDALPVNVVAAARSVERTPELVFCLLLDEESEVRQRQLNGLDARHGRDYAQRVAMLFEVLRGDLDRLRLPLLELATPRLRRMDRDQAERFLHDLLELSAADGRLSLFELLLTTLVRRVVLPKPAREVRFHRFDQVASDLAILFWVLIRVVPGETERDRAFWRRTLQGFVRDVEQPPRDDSVSVVTLQRIMLKLDGLAPLLKSPVLQACHDCIARHGPVEPAAAELLRTVAVLMGVPIALGDSGVTGSGTKKTRPP